MGCCVSILILLRLDGPLLTLDIVEQRKRQRVPRPLRRYLSTRSQTSQWRGRERTREGNDRNQHGEFAAFAQSHWNTDFGGMLEGKAEWHGYQVQQGQDVRDLYVFLSCGLVCWVGNWWRGWSSWSLLGETEKLALNDLSWVGREVVIDIVLTCVLDQLLSGDGEYIIQASNSSQFRIIFKGLASRFLSVAHVDSRRWAVYCNMSVLRKHFAIQHQQWGCHIW